MLVIALNAFRKNQIGNYYLFLHSHDLIDCIITQLNQNLFSESESSRNRLPGAL